MHAPFPPLCRPSVRSDTALFLLKSGVSSFPPPPFCPCTAPTPSPPLPFLWRVGLPCRGRKGGRKGRLRLRPPRLPEDREEEPLAAFGREERGARPPLGGRRLCPCTYVRMGGVGGRKGAGERQFPVGGRGGGDATKRGGEDDRVIDWRRLRPKRSRIDRWKRERELFHVFQQFRGKKKGHHGHISLGVAKGGTNRREW